MSTPHTYRYHPLLVALHWLMVPLVIGALTLGSLVMTRLPNTHPMRIEALRSHMIGGAVILVLMLMRLGVRVRTAHPVPAQTGSRILDRLARASHHLLYVVVLSMAGSGLFMALQTGLPRILFGSGGALPADFWVYPIRTVHYLLSRLVMALIALHVLGVLYHTVIRRDGLLRRMLFGRRIASGISVSSGGTAPRSRRTRTLERSGRATAETSQRSSSQSSGCYEART